MTQMLMRGLNRRSKGLTQWDRESEADQFITVLHNNEKEIDLLLILVHTKCLIQEADSHRFVHYIKYCCSI